MRKYGGLIAGVLLLLLAVVLGWMFQQALLPPDLADLSHGVVRSDSELKLITKTVVGLAGIGPAIVALVMLWIAFIRVDVRDRYLWSAVTIISAPNVAGVLEWLIPDPNGHWPTMRSMYFVNVPIAAGIIAYAALFLAIAKDSKRPSLAIVPLVALIMLVVLPIPTAFVSWATMICTISATCGIWAIAVWIAAQVGFDVYESESGELPDAV